jgi:glycosyltransferase involved in cell wall biosynthesis
VIRLLQITHDLAIGGLQQVVATICKTIDRNRFDISVLCLRNLGQFTAEIRKLNIPVTLLQQKENGPDYFSFLKVAKHIKNNKIDIIHTHNTQPFIDGVIGGMLSGGKPVVHTDHARIFPDKRRYMLAERLLSKFVYKVAAVSNKTSDDLVQYIKIPRKKIVTITNGIIGSEYKVAVHRERQPFHYLKSNGPVIGTVGRLVKEKGLTYLLKAMKIVLQSMPQAHLIIVGDGYLRNDLEKKAKIYNINEHVTFTGNRIDIPELLNLFDVFVCSSVSEGLPVVLLEAMAASCPIVSTDVGGIPTIIDDHKNGLLVQPRNPLALASSIIEMLERKEDREKYVRNSLKTFYGKYDARVMTKCYENLYIEAIMCRR